MSHWHCELKVTRRKEVNDNGGIKRHQQWVVLKGMKWSIRRIVVRGGLCFRIISLNGGSGGGLQDIECEKRRWWTWPSLRSETEWTGRWSGWIADEMGPLWRCVREKENGQEAKETNDWENWNGADVFKNCFAKLTGVLQWMNEWMSLISADCGAFSDDTTWRDFIADQLPAHKKSKTGLNSSGYFRFLQRFALMHFFYEYFRNSWRELIKFSFIWLVFY